MKGIQYLTGGAGHQTAIVIDLATWGELIENFLDAALMQSRQDEPDIPWEEAERRLDELSRKERSNDATVFRR